MRAFDVTFDTLIHLCVEKVHMLLRTNTQNDNLNEKQNGSKTERKEKLCIKSITEKNLYLCNSSGLVHKRLCIFKTLIKNSTWFTNKYESMFFKKLKIVIDYD